MSMIGDEMKKVLLAGIGAVAVTAEKSQQMIDTLIKKGEITVEQGKVLNEELKNNIKDTIDKRKEDKTDESVGDLTKKIASMTPEELAELKAKIEEMEKGGE